MLRNVYISNENFVTQNNPLIIRLATKATEMLSQSLHLLSDMLNHSTMSVLNRKNIYE